MIGLDDVMDVAVDALTAEAPGEAPVLLASVTTDGDRITTRVLGRDRDLIGVRQNILIEGVGGFSILIEERGDG